MLIHSEFRTIPDNAFQGLAKHFQHAAVELGQFVQKQDAVVGQSDFPWLRAAAAVGFRNKREAASLEVCKQGTPLSH